MNRNAKLSGLFAALGMLALILDGQTALSGAAEGIELCIRTVVPSLFPFFLLSITLTGAVSRTSSPLLRPLSILFETPKGTETLLLTSFLGGYPVGAQCVSQAYRKGQLNKELAGKMLSFCNNAGPSFIFGMAAMQFSSPIYGWLIWGVQMLSAAAVARILPAGQESTVGESKPSPTSLSDAMHIALRVMATVCGWVVVFRVILSFLDRWLMWLMPQSAQVLLTGLLELANGCCNLSRIENHGLRFILCSLMLSLGGVCVFMQTSSVLQGLPVKHYLKGKALQGIFALLLSSMIQIFLPGGVSLHPGIAVPILIFVLGFSGYFLRKKQTGYSFSA